MFKLTVAKSEFFKLFFVKKNDFPNFANFLKTTNALWEWVCCAAVQVHSLGRRRVGFRCW
jgi:hypothetical protein